MKETEIELLKNRLEVVEGDLLSYKMRCKKYKEYIKNQVLDTNICVADYFKNNKIVNNLIDIPSGSFVENSFHHHPLYLPSVSMDDQFDSKENDQTKDQTDDNERSSKLVINESNLPDLDEFNIESSTEENTKSSMQKTKT